MSNETNDFDFDFSSKGGGQVSSLESFLDDTPPVIEGADPKPAEPIIDLGGADPKPDETIIEVDPNKPIIDLGGDDPKPDDVVVDPLDLGLPTGEEDDDTPASTTGLDYKSVIQKLVDEKVWDGIDAFETEDGEVSFEDMDIDEETFLEIYKQKNEELRNNLLEDKVSTKKVSDFTKKLIEIEANGGNVQQALQSYNQYKSPLEGLDLSKESDQQAAIYLKYQAKGVDDKDILDLIKTIKTNGELESRALEAKTDVETAFNKQMESINQQAIDAKSKRTEDLKVYKSSLGENLKTFELSDSYRRKLVDIASKEDDNGQFKLDSMYYELRQDPEKAAELVLFLTNKEEYIKQVTANQAREQQIDTMRRIKLVPKGKSSIKIKDDKKKSSGKNLLDLNEFN